MKRFGIVICAVLAGSSAARASGEWYKGGDLHQKKIRDWKRATDQNRLATAGDFISITDAPLNVTLVKAKALVRCINEAGADAHSDNMTVAEIGAACMILMDHKK